MKKTYLLGGGIAVLTAAILAGCNGNDDDGTPTTPAAATTQSLTVTPSLGKILNAKVVARNAKTGIEIGTGNTGNTGIASFNVTKTADPVVVEVQGSATAKYVDESRLSSTNNGETNFDAAQKIRVAIPALTTNIGVSTLTEVAYQTALKKVSNDEKAITADIATQANDAIRKALAPELTSITAAPTVIGSMADLAALQNTEAGKYALKLAALAKLISSEDPTPALTVLNKLASDIADGNFDGKAGVTALGTYTSANLAAKIQANINATIAANNLSGLNINVSSFNPAFGNIVITVAGTGGGTGSGQNCALNANYNVQGIPLSYTVCYTNFPQNAVCGAGNQAFSGANIPGFNGTFSWTYSQVATCPAGSIQVNYVN